MEMGKMICLGIDPGLSGGLAAICNGKANAIAMPATERDIWDWFCNGEIAGEGKFNPSRSFAVIEKVHSMPKQGVASSFKFGRNTGLLLGFLVAAGIPFEEVTPQKWQKSLNISPRKDVESKTQWKNRLKETAQRLFPSETVTLATADSLLLAEFCRRSRRGVQASES